MEAVKRKYGDLKMDKESMEYTENLRQAAKEYKDRQKRYTHPSGSFDRAGRWEPDDSERQDCCDDVREPSRAYPYSLMVHCRSMEHVANLYDVDKADLQQQLRKNEQLEIER